MIVLITGATSGFGMSCAELFSKKGYKTILIGRRKERLTKLSKKLGLKKNLAIQLDVRDKEEVFNTINNLPRNFKAVDAKVFFENNDELAYTTALRNSSLQAGYFLKAVNALGLDAGPMSGFDNKGVDDEFFKDTSIRSNFLCTLGYGIEPKGHPRGARYKFDEVAKII